MRGGSWNNNSENCRVANRNNNTPENRNNNNGFRVACQLITTPDGSDEQMSALFYVSGLWAHTGQKSSFM
ncbi:MAG: hypothetical protein R3D00_22610 [Bacteroidia bacterium]